MADDHCATVSVLLRFRLDQGFNMSYQWPSESNLRPKNTEKSIKGVNLTPVRVLELNFAHMSTVTLSVTTVTTSAPLFECSYGSGSIRASI